MPSGPRRAALADALLEASQLLERGEQDPGAHRVGSPGHVGNQPNDTVAAAQRRLELEDGLDCLPAQTAYATRRRALRCEAEVAPLDLGLAGHDKPGDLRCA